MCHGQKKTTILGSSTHYLVGIWIPSLGRVTRNHTTSFGHGTYMFYPLVNIQKLWKVTISNG